MSESEVIGRHFEEHFFVSGHTACSGCGQSMGARLVADTAGKNTMIANATGCLEVFSTKCPESSWRVPWVHSLFENAAAVASGIDAALRNMNRDDINVLAFAGDGGTADIGLQALSGMLERGHNVLFVCYDNEAYMNTGIQRSGLTPTGASTTTSPSGKVWWGNWRPKKNVVGIAAAHLGPYVASASVGYPQDVIRKVKKALSIKGPKFIQLHVPCPLGWGSEPSQTIKIAQLAVQTGLYPLVEYEHGKLTKTFQVPKPAKVEEYLSTQKRFRHILKDPELIKHIQEIADFNISFFNLKSNGS